MLYIFFLLSLVHQIQVTDNVNFNSILIDEITSENTYSVVNPLNNGEFYWRVRAKEFYEWSDWSEIWKFIIDTYIPPTPVLISPSNNAVLNDLTPTFIWSTINKIPPYPPYNGDTLFVGLDGNDSYIREEAKNYNTPFRTIQRAMDEVLPGDMVIVKDGIYQDAGTYHVYCDYGGTSDNWVILKSENLYGAKLDGQNSTVTYGISFNPFAPYIFVEGFEIYGFKKGGIWIHNDCHDYYFYKNKIHDIRMNVTSGQEGYPGIMIKKTNKNITVDGNIIYNIGRLPHDPPADIDFKADHGIYAQGYNIRIQNNIIYNCHAGFCIKIDGNEFGYSGFTHIITNNTFAFPSNPHRPGHIRIYKNPALTYSPRALIQNCIFYEPPMPADSNDQRHCIEQRANHRIIVRNCFTSVDSIFDVYGNAFDSTDVINCITGVNPYMVNPEGLDFRLSDSSLCIDIGIDEYAPSYDFNGNLRPQWFGYDIGAYEYNED